MRSIPRTRIERPYASRRLRERMYLRAAILHAPAGYGKATLIRELAAGGSSIVVDVREGATFSRFANDLVAAAAELVPGIDRSFAGAFSRASQSGDVPRTFALWFVRQVADTPCRIVVDGLERARGSVVGTFLQRAIEASPTSLTWLVATQHLETIAANSLLAFGLATLPIDEHDLRLRAHELKSLAAATLPAIARADLRTIGEKAAGSISDAHFLLNAYACGVREVADAAVPFERICEDVFGGLSRERQRAMLLATLVPAALPADPPFLFETDGRTIQASFARWLRARFERLDAGDREELCVSAAAELERVGDVRGALALLVRVSDETATLRCIERHATRALEREQLHFLHDAVASLSDEARRSHPIVLSILAIEASLEAQADIAESLFQNALESAKKSGAASQAHSIRYWYACELVRRDRNDAIALLRPDADFFRARPRLRVAMMSTLGVAYAKDGQLDRGQRWVDRALRGAARVPDDALRAHVHHQASYIALCAEHAHDARRLAECALLYADSAGAAQIATAASSVLYAVAIDLEDDLEDAVRQLQRLATYAARAGNVSGQLYALAALFEVETDRGNVRAIAAIERELDVFDLQYGAAVESETIVPAEAMQHAWRGGFERAYRILEGSDEQQFTDDRRALRLAEIGLYAAAAGHDREAHAAVAKALAYLKAGDADLRTLRARAFSALALVVLGSTADAREQTRELDVAAPVASRSATLAKTIAALADRRDGFPVSRTISRTLEELRRLEWGGIARVVGALPSRAVAAVRYHEHGESLVS